MSYVSLLKNIPEILSQPTGIAAIASFGIHGAIALFVPLMPVDSSQSKESASAKSVGIVELSQADQARLPQTPDQTQVALQPQLPELLPQQQLPQQPQVTLPNLDSQASLMPVVPPAAYMQRISPPITTTPNKYRTNYLPKQLSRQWVMPKDTFGDTSRFNAVNTKPNTSRSDLSRGIITPKFQPRNQLPVLPQGEILPDLQKTGPVSTSDASSGIIANNSTSSIGQPDNNQVTPNQPLINPPGQPPNLVDNLTPTGRSASLPDTSTPKIPELPPTSKHGSLVALAAHAKLRNEVKQQYPNSQEKPVIRETIATDKPDLEGTVSGYLVVDSQGKHVIKYEDKLVAPELKLKITQYFNSKAPKGDKQTILYPFNLRFQNNANNTAGATQGQTSGVVTPKPLSGAVTGNQPTPSPATTNKLMQELRNRNGKSAPASTTPVKPSSTQEANKTQVSPSVTSTSRQNLIRELNKVRQERQGSNSEK